MTFVYFVILIAAVNKYMQGLSIVTRICWIPFPRVQSLPSLWLLMVKWTWPDSDKRDVPDLSNQQPFYHKHQSDARVLLPVTDVPQLSRS